MSFLKTTRIPPEESRFDDPFDFEDYEVYASMTTGTVPDNVKTLFSFTYLDTKNDKNAKNDELVTYYVDFGNSTGTGSERRQDIIIYRISISSEDQFNKSYTKAVKNFEGKHTNPKQAASVEYAKFGFYEIFKGSYSQSFNTSGEPTTGTGNPFTFLKSNSDDIDNITLKFNTLDVVNEYLKKNPTEKLPPGMTGPQAELPPKTSRTDEPDFKYSYSGLEYWFYFTLDGNTIKIEAYHTFPPNSSDNKYDKARVAELGENALFMYFIGSYEGKVTERWEGLDFTNKGDAFKIGKQKTLRDEKLIPENTLSLITMQTGELIRLFYGNEKQKMIKDDKTGVPELYPSNPSVTSEYIVLKVEMDDGLWYTHIILNESAKVERALHKNETVARNTVKGQVAYFSVKHRDIPADFPKVGGDILNYAEVDKLIKDKIPDKIQIGFDKGSYEEYKAAAIGTKYTITKTTPSLDFPNDPTQNWYDWAETKVPLIETLGEYAPLNTGRVVSVGLPPLFPPQKLLVNFTPNGKEVPGDMKSPEKETFIAAIDTLIEYLYFYPDINIEITGHTSVEGNNNQKLSEQRAANTKKYMLGKSNTIGEGANKKTITLTEARFLPTIGRGSLDALATVDDPEAKKALDRNITIRYVPK